MEEEHACMHGIRGCVVVDCGCGLCIYGCLPWIDTRDVCGHENTSFAFSRKQVLLILNSACGLNTMQFFWHTIWHSTLRYCHTGQSRAKTPAILAKQRCRHFQRSRAFCWMFSVPDRAGPISSWRMTFPCQKHTNSNFSCNNSHCVPNAKIFRKTHLQWFQKRPSDRVTRFGLVLTGTCKGEICQMFWGKFVGLE